MIAIAVANYKIETMNYFANALNFLAAL